MPLAPRVTEGAWGSTDARLMREALEDADATLAGAAIAAPSPDAAAADAKPRQQKAPGRRAQAAALFSKVLLGRSPEDLRALAASHGQPAYRGDQLYAAITGGAGKEGSAAHDLAGVGTLPKAWRERLAAEGWHVGRPLVTHEAAAPDGTRKLLLRLADGHEIETVGIPVDKDDDDDGMSGGGGGGGGGGFDGERRQAAAARRGGGGGGPAAAPAPSPLRQQSPATLPPPSAASRRLTCCVSTMAGGCPLRCSFCATGRSAFARNLAPHEILAQAMAVRDAFGGRRIGAVVFMGGGEPLVNLPSVLEAVALLRRDLGLSGRSITLSTVGVPHTIARLAEARLPVTLAVSLHAPNQALRERLVPSARAYPIDELMSDCAAYFRSTGRRVTFEYTLMAGENDSPEHARELAALLRRHGMLPSAAASASAAAAFASAGSGRATPAASFASSSSPPPPSSSMHGGAHVNLIPYNSVEGTGYARPSRTRVYEFRKALQEAAGRAISVSVRATRGEEANAACGQLAYQANEVRAAAAGAR